MTQFYAERPLVGKVKNLPNEISKFCIVVTFLIVNIQKINKVFVRTLKVSLSLCTKFHTSNTKDSLDIVIKPEVKYRPVDFL
jgi:hypothetical protein